MAEGGDTMGGDTMVMSELVDFALEHAWVWDGQVTKFFSEQWWTRIPPQWSDVLLQLSTEQLNNLPFGSTEGDWPASLKHFVTKSESLSMQRNPPTHVIESAVPIERGVAKGMTPKKLHEVSHVAGVIRDVCTATSCSIVLDIGAGLGYLGDCLSKQCGLLVVGLEREPERVQAAQRRAHHCPEEQNLKGESEDHVMSTRDNVSVSRDCHTTLEKSQATKPFMSGDSHVTDDWLTQLATALPSEIGSPCKLSLGLTVDGSPSTASKLNILLDYLKKHVSQDFIPAVFQVCLVGLHCCGDLSTNILQIFNQRIHQSIKGLVLLGCCYHKTEHAQWRPLSKQLTMLLQSREKTGGSDCSEAARGQRTSGCRDSATEGCDCSQTTKVQSTSCCTEGISTFGLRLAAQETRHRWRGQSAEEHHDHVIHVAFRGMLEVASGGRVLPRKALRALKYNSIQEYATTVAANLNDGDIEQELMSYYATHECFMKYIEPFTALQVCLQGLLESLVLLDRLTFLRECGFPETKLLPVFHPSISPRNVALLVTNDIGRVL